MRRMSTPEPTSTPRPQASISVIVPSYNGGTSIAEARLHPRPDPAGQADHRSSTTARPITPRKWSAATKSKRIQYLRGPHEGLATACNAGLEAARGEFVTFLHAGDRWSPTFVERMYDYLSEDPGIACAFSNFVHLDDATGKMLGDQFRHYPEIKRPVLLKDAPHAHGRIPKERAFGALGGLQ